MNISQRICCIEDNNARHPEIIFVVENRCFYPKSNQITWQDLTQKGIIQHSQNPTNASPPHISQVRSPARGTIRERTCVRQFGHSMSVGFGPTGRLIST